MNNSSESQAGDGLNEEPDPPIYVIEDLNYLFGSFNQSLLCHFILASLSRYVSSTRHWKYLVIRSGWPTNYLYEDTPMNHMACFVVPSDKFVPVCSFVYSYVPEVNGCVNKYSARCSAMDWPVQRVLSWFTEFISSRCAVLGGHPPNRETRLR